MKDKFWGIGLNVCAVCLLLFLVQGCAQKVNVAEPAGRGEGYRIYESIPLKIIGNWIETDISVSNGDLVAVLAKGETWPTQSPTKRWQPYQNLRFRIGTKGSETPISAGANRRRDPTNMSVVKAEKGGNLSFLIKGKPDKFSDNITVTVILWDRGSEDRIEEGLGVLMRSHPGDRQFKKLWSQLAGLFIRTGDYDRADRIYAWAEKNFRVDVSMHTGLLLSLAMKEYWLGRYNKSISLSEQARELSSRKGQRMMEVRSMIVEARGASALGEHEKAVALGKEALTMAGRNRRLRGGIHFSLGSSYLGMNRLEEAYEHLDEALNYLPRKGAHPLLAECLLGLGEIQMKWNKPGKARDYFESAIRQAKAMSQPQPLWIAHSQLGRIADGEGDLDRAFLHYDEAIRSIEGMRGKLSDPQLRARFMENKLHVYEWMIKLLRRMNRDPDALHYLERAKARSLLDMLGEKAFSSKDKAENELLSQERELRRRIEDLSLEVAETSLDTSDDSGELSGELATLREQHRAVLERISSLNPELASLVSIRPLKAGEIQALLDPDTALLEYFLGKEIMVVFVVTREGVVSVPLQGQQEKLYEMVRKFREDAVEKISLEWLAVHDYRTPLSEMYELLIRPLEGHISGKKHLVIVPHGMLHYLPFHALVSGKGGRGRYLLEDYAISYAPSGSVLTYARMKNRGKDGNVFAVGNPKTDLPPLPAAEKEAVEVSELFLQKLVLTGKGATESSVKKLSPEYDTVLLSTHGKMMESDPLKSNLMFTPSEEDDGKLTVGEIFDMELKANLVTLSACETGLAKGAGGVFPQGDDLVGLSRAFIYAGAPSVVASLWEVSDDSTVELMLHFFKHLRSMPKAEALRRAQMDLMKSRVNFRQERGARVISQSPEYRPGMGIECSHPYFWAPFILLGDWR